MLNPELIVNQIDVQQGSVNAITVLPASFYQKVAIALITVGQLTQNIRSGVSVV